MKKNTVIILFSFIIVLFGGVLIVNSQCNNHLPSKELQCGSTEFILLTRDSDDVNCADSVVWSVNGRTVHLYKYDKDETDYLIKNEYDHELIRKYNNSETVLNCCKVMQVKLLNSLNSLSRNQLDALLQDTLGRSSAFLIECVLDNDGNMILTEGLVLQDEKYWTEFLGREIVPENNSCELYFEESDIEAFVEKLESYYPEVKYVNRLMTHSWGQKVVRFYDPDGNLIEVGTPV